MKKVKRNEGRKKVVRDRTGIAYLVFNTPQTTDEINKELSFIRKVNGVAPGLEIKIHQGTDLLPACEAARDVAKNCAYSFERDPDFYGQVYTAIGRFPRRTNNAAALELGKLLSKENFPDSYEDHPFYVDGGSQEVIWEMTPKRFVDFGWSDKAEEMERRK